MIATGLRVLRSRYLLISRFPIQDGLGETWLGIDDDDDKYLIKLWAFAGDRPDDLQRALWDRELRTPTGWGVPPVPKSPCSSCGMPGSTEKLAASLWF